MKHMVPSVPTFNQLLLSPLELPGVSSILVGIFSVLSTCAFLYLSSVSSVPSCKTSPNLCLDVPSTYAFLNLPSVPSVSSCKESSCLSREPSATRFVLRVFSSCKVSRCRRAEIAAAPCVLLVSSCLTFPSPRV